MTSIHANEGSTLISYTYLMIPNDLPTKTLHDPKRISGKTVFDVFVG